MANRTFAEIFDEMLRLCGCSLGQISARLVQRGYRTNRSTLKRWRDGANRPSFENLEVLRHLPKAMGLSTAETARFLNEISQALGFYVAETHPAQVAAEPLAQRLHFGSEALFPFVGRQADLTALQQRVTQKQSVAIVGLAGMGKTRLAQALLQSSVKAFAHGCEFLEIGPGQGRLQVAQNVARLLDVDLPAASRQGNNVEWVLEQIRARSTGASLLFLVDNVDSAEQVRDLVRLLPNLTWIFTARRLSLKNAGVYTLPLAAPSADEAIQIFQTFAHALAQPAADESAALHEIVENLGRLPLALRLAAGLLDNGIVANLDELRGWLARKGLLSARSLSNLQYLFDYLLANLPEDAQRIFELCGVFAVPKIHLISLRRIIQSLEITPSLEAWTSLSDLSLITYPDNRHIELHHLVHEYAQLRLRASPRYTAIWGKFQAYYLQLLESAVQTGDEAHRNCLHLLSEEPNLLGVINNLYQTSAWAMLEQLWPIVEEYFWKTGNVVDDENFMQMCLQAAEKSGNHPWLANICSRFGFFRAEQKRWSEAENFLLRSQELYDLSPEAYFDQARVRRYRALWAIGQRKLDLAAGLLADAEARLNRLSSSPEPRLEVNYLWLHTAKMNVFYMQGHLEQAEAEGRIANQFYENLSRAGPFRARDFKIILGDVLFNRGQTEAALQLWREMLQDDGLPYQPEEADAQLRLAWIDAQAGETARALELAAAARTIFAKFGAGDKLRLADTLIAAIQGGQPIPAFMALFAY